MKFKNKPNTPHNIGNKIIWENRSVAVNAVIVILKDRIPYILVSKRGPNAADNIGKINVVAGYLDWDETGRGAVLRETWEECGLNLEAFVKDCSLISYNIHQPWSVTTSPNENHQNVSLRYGIAVESDILPELSTEHNEVEGEIEKAWWMPIGDINNYQWAFDHDKVIKEYLEKVGYFSF